MKLLTFVLTTLPAILYLVSAGTVHLDISSSGDVAVDIDTHAQKSTSFPEARAKKSFRPRRPKAQILEDYQVDLYYEIHQGFLSVRFFYSVS